MGRNSFQGLSREHIGEIGWSFVVEECTGSVVLSMLDDFGNVACCSLSGGGRHRVERVAHSYVRNWFYRESLEMLLLVPVGGKLLMGLNAVSDVKARKPSERCV